MKPSSLTDVDIDKPSDAVIEDSRLHQEHNARLTRSILFKTDTRVLPILALLFLCSFLDRTNVGNAKIIGLAEDLGISNLQYNQGLAVFYATYIARSVAHWHPVLPTIHTRTSCCSMQPCGKLHHGKLTSERMSSSYSLAKQVTDHVPTQTASSPRT